MFLEIYMYHFFSVVNKLKLWVNNYLKEKFWSLFQIHFLENKYFLLFYILYYICPFPTHLRTLSIWSFIQLIRPNQKLLRWPSLRLLFLLQTAWQLDQRDKKIKQIALAPLPVRRRQENLPCQLAELNWVRQKRRQGYHHPLWKFHKKFLIDHLPNAHQIEGTTCIMQ